MKTKQELFSQIWETLNKSLGSVDISELKFYVLGFLFYRYISENIINHFNKNEHAAGNVDFDYAKLNDDEISDDVISDCINSKGFFIFPSELFNNVYEKYKNNPNDLNVVITNIFKNIDERSLNKANEQDIIGLLTGINLSSNNLGENVTNRNKKIIKIIAAIASFELSNFDDDEIDIFGDAYEYIIDMYASKSGKRSREFFDPPQEVSKLLTLLAIKDKKDIKTVYDPMCRSGSLLLQPLKILKNPSINFYGQENVYPTYNLCRMNMFLHNVNCSNFDIQYGDTLTNPKHSLDQRYDIIVSSPPYSIKWEGQDNPILINDERYSPAGILAPKSYADIAFIMHSLYLLKASGTAAIVCYHGIFYRSGAEQKIRKYLVDNNFIDTIIRLPDNLFYGKQVIANILVLSKSKKDNGILFIDASNLFIKVANQKKLSDENIDEIIKLYHDRKDVDKLSRFVSQDEIVGKDYDLQVDTYILKNLYILKNDETDAADIKQLNEEINQLSKINQESKQAIREIINELEDKQIDDSINEFSLDKLFNFYGKDVEQLPLWKITIWNKKFQNTYKSKQDKLNKFKSISSKILKDINLKTGNVKLLSAVNFDGWTNEILAGENLSEGEIITLQELLISDASPKIKYWNGKFVNSGNLICTTRDSSMYNTKYIYYFLRNNISLIKSFYRGRGTVQFKNPDMSEILEICIPIPPLEIQEKIVKILDTFTEMEIKMETEIKKRIKQHKYYCNKLLTFKVKNNE